MMRFVKLFISVTFIVLSSCSTSSKLSNDSIGQSKEYDLSFLNATKNRSYVDSAGNVFVVDPVLRARLRIALEISTNEKITIQKISKTTILKLNNSFHEKDLSKKIKNIDALAYFKNLEILELQNHQIKDISFLGELIHLESLDIKLNLIKDISPLARLGNLKSISLYRNNVNSINALENLTELEELNLFGNNITKINALQNLVKIVKLNLGANQISNISPLEPLVKLEDLNLLNCYGINPTSLLTFGSNLITLSLVNCGVEDITFLENCTKLENLLIFGNKISDITVLENMPNLNVLLASNNQIENIDVLALLVNNGTAFTKKGRYRGRLNIDLKNNRIVLTRKNLKIMSFLEENVSMVQF